MTETVEVTKVAEVAPAAADSDDPPSYEVSTSEAGHLEDKAQPEKFKDKTEGQSQEPPGKAAEASTEKSSEKKPEASVEQSAPKITVETASEAKTEEKQPAETSSAEKPQKGELEICTSGSPRCMANSGTQMPRKRTTRSSRTVH